MMSEGNSAARFSGNKINCRLWDQSCKCPHMGAKTLLEQPVIGKHPSQGGVLNTPSCLILEVPVDFLHTKVDILIAFNSIL